MDSSSEIEFTLPENYSNMAGWKVSIIQYPPVNDHISSHQTGKPENHQLESAGWDGIF